MKRKTNLFNLSNENSLFLTFSNYTEYLTGNFLSTNTKIYPSSFLCLNLNVNDEHTLIGFKKYLMQYYENKLTALRTACVKEEYHAEDYITPLFYLLDTIDKYFGETDIVYAGDIVEQDYNGTYSDSICIINLNTGYNVEKTINEEKISEESEETIPKITGVPVLIDITEDNDIEEGQENQVSEQPEEDNEDKKEYIKIKTIELNSLFNWTGEQINSLYGENIEPEYDETIENLPSYYFGSFISDLEFTARNKDSIDPNENITFNCIIPLFDIRSIKEFTVTSENNEKDYMKRNIPLGIWLSPEEIKVAKNSGFAQSWSLVVGSKFSPLPYSSINAIDDNNSFDANTVKDIAYLTYAELLTKHSELQNKYDECLKNNIILSTKLNNIEKQLSSLLLQSDYDKIISHVDEKIQELQKNFDNKMKVIEEYIANLKWKYIN